MRTDHRTTCGPWLAFGPTWFARWQWLLLLILDEPLLGRWLRWILCIRPCDVGHRRRIVRLLPHGYICAGDRPGTFVLDARTHWKYSKRIYHAFRPLWWMLHAWDWLLADRLAPSWSYGFATLTAFPDPDPETATVDGDVARSGVDETWATIRAGAGTTHTDTSTTAEAFRIHSSGTTDQWQVVRRAIFLFDTSALGTDAVISAAVLSLFGNLKADNLAITPNCDIYTSTPASNTDLVNADFGQIGSTSQTGSPIAYADLSATAYNDFTFNALGRSNVSKTSVSKFGSRNTNYDVAAVAPSWGSLLISRFVVVAADTAGTTSDPKLVVTYMGSPAGAVLEAELSGAGNGWTDITEDSNLGAETVTIDYGIRGGGPIDRVASVGTMTWSMRNSARTSGGVNGYYTPGHASARSGWEIGIAVRLRIRVTEGGTTYYKFRGTLVSVLPETGTSRRRSVQCLAHDWIDEAMNSFVRDTGVQENKRSDQIISTLVTNSARRQPAATSYATGQSTFTFGLDNLRDERTALLRALADATYAEVGYLYVKGDTTQGGTLRFEDRHARPKAASAATYTNTTMHGLEVVRSRENIYNHINAIVHPRKLDAAATTVVYSLTDTETVPAIAAGETLPITVFFRDATGQFVRVGAKDVVTPVASTDYLGNAAADGSGADLTANLSLVFTSTSNSATLSFTNNGTATVHLTTLQVRGRVVADRYELSIFKHNVTSETSYGERDLNYDMVFEDRVPYALGLCDWFLSIYGSPKTIVSSMQLRHASTDSGFTTALAREPGDKITITESMSGLSAVPYVINGVRLAIHPGAIYEFSWTLAPADAQAVWILEDATGGLLETSTYLGFI